MLDHLNAVNRTVCTTTVRRTTYQLDAFLLFFCLTSPTVIKALAHIEHPSMHFRNFQFCSPNPYPSSLHVVSIRKGDTSRSKKCNRRVDAQTLNVHGTDETKLRLHFSSNFDPAAALPKTCDYLAFEDVLIISAARFTVQFQSMQ